MKKKKNRGIEMEKVPLMAIYRDNGKLHLRMNEDEVNIYELYGFLKCYTRVLELDLQDNIDFEDYSGD